MVNSYNVFTIASFACRELWGKYLQSVPAGGGGGGGSEYLQSVPDCGFAEGGVSVNAYKVFLIPGLLIWG